MAATRERIKRVDTKAKLDDGGADAHYEFGGPIGAAGIMVFLPLVALLLNEVCEAPAPGGAAPRQCDIAGFPARLAARLEAVAGPAAIARSLATAAAAVLGYLAAALALHVALPGAIEDGAPLRDGRRLRYKLNALAVLLVSVPGFLALCRAGAVDPVYVYDNVAALMGAGIALSYALSAWLYVGARARRGGGGAVVLAEGGDTGNPLYDFFIGHELNPRVRVPGLAAEVDLKEWCELTPGLLAWLLLDICCAFKQYSLHGYVSNAMVLVIAFHALYVLDALYLEKAILTTMDITTDGFGFMLVFGDLIWVPFTYSLQARYLAVFPSDLSAAALAAVLALKAAGYLAFRGSNNQKNAFRSLGHDHPANRHIRYINTERGTRLMVSGWWGIARHINYTGDWVMGLAWSLPCGFTHVLPYFYPIYFACLLIHREGATIQSSIHACAAADDDDDGDVHWRGAAGGTVSPAAGARGGDRPDVCPTARRARARRPRRAPVPRQVRQGLGQVQEHRQVPAHPVYILIPPACGVVIVPGSPPSRRRRGPPLGRLPVATGAPPLSLLALALRLQRLRRLLHVPDEPARRLDLVHRVHVHGAAEAEERAADHPVRHPERPRHRGHRPARSCAAPAAGPPHAHAPLRSCAATRRHPLRVHTRAATATATATAR